MSMAELLMHSATGEEYDLDPRNCFLVSFRSDKGLYILEHLIFRGEGFCKNLIGFSNDAIAKALALYNSFEIYQTEMDFEQEYYFQTMFSEPDSWSLHRVDGPQSKIVIPGPEYI